MDITRQRTPPASESWAPAIKDEAFRRIAGSPLVEGCATHGNAGRHAFALVAGFWPFVDAFPAIIRRTYGPTDAAPDKLLRRFQRRAGAILANTLVGMESDERDHRALWLRSARSLGLSEAGLGRLPVLPEVRQLVEAVGNESSLARRLLYFVAVEMVAESVARVVSASPRFVAAMGEPGMGWFAAHRLSPGETGAHEALAYKLALAVKRAAREPVDPDAVAADILRCIDWFVAAGAACEVAFCPAADLPGGRRLSGGG